MLYRFHFAVVCGKSFNQKSNVRTHIERHKTWPKTFRVAVQ